jgi:hypothetical protein
MIRWQSFSTVIGYRRSWRTLWLRRTPVIGTVYYQVDADGFPTNTGGI